MPRQRRPHGRDEVMAAVRAAALALLAERSPREISVRDIAARAGVNHALVHRHFGSKQDLLRTVLRDQSGEIAAAARALPHPTTEAALTLLRRYPAYWRGLARAALDAPELLRDREFPAADAFLQLLGGRADAAAPRTPAALAGALALGWTLFGQHLSAALDADPAHVDAALADAVRLLLTQEP